MKRLLYHIVLMLFIVGLAAGCGGQTPEPNEGPSPAEEEEAAPAEEEEAAPAEEEEAAPAEEEEAAPAEEEEAAAGSEFTGTLVIAKADEPNSIDPHVHDGWYSVRAHSAVYETLVDMRWDPDAEEVVFDPLLAESWEVSDDRLTYTFHLRDGVTFHDGTPFTSEAVKVTFERNKALGMRASWQVAPIATIETPDDLTVVLTLNEPYTPFLMAMSRAYIMNPVLITENDQGDNAQAFFNENMNGTGPYTFVRWDRDSVVEFEAFPDYWGGWEGKHFERIILRHVPDRATQRLLIERGEVDFAQQIAPEDAAALQSVEGVTVFDGPSTALFTFPLKQRGPLEDLVVRQALSYAFPYEDAIEGIRGGYGQRIYGPFPEGVLGYTEEGLTEYQYDLERAAELLEEAGWTDTDGDGIVDKDGEPLSLTVWTTAALAYEREAALLWQAALSQIGVELTVEEQSAIATFVSATYDYDAPADAYGWVTSMFIPDPSDIARQYHTRNWEGLNTAFYGDEEVDALVDEGTQLPDGEERQAVYEELNRLLSADAPHVYVWQERKLVVHRDNIQGFVYNPVDYIREFRYYDMWREE